VFLNSGDLDKAVDSYNKAIAIYDKTKGKRHPVTGTPHVNIIAALTTKGDYPQALDHLQIAYEIYSPIYAPESSKIRDLTESFANIYCGLKRYREAMDAAQKALELNKKLEGPESPELRFSLQYAGKALIGLNRSTEAIPVLEKSLKYFEGEKGAGLDDLGETRFALARALREAKRDPERAAVLATRAREDFVATKAPRKAEEVERWLRSAPVSSGGKRRNVLGSRDY
jgi:tetratricopeptide (TPR) repeat protein